jgi:hypothetical protein
MTFPDPLTRQQIDEFFPRERKPIKDGAFELGLVLGGTVAAGAYTAGVLDYLLEALDAWQRAKDDGDPQAPAHDVILSTIAGTSGGGINGAVVLRSASWAYPHGPDPQNPFYATWTTGVDLMKLLAPGLDKNVPGLASVLKCDSIDLQANGIIGFPGVPLSDPPSPQTAALPARRRYLADPLRLFVTTGNVGGVPYTIRMSGESQLSHQLVAHADHMRFALSVDGGVPTTPATPQTRPDEIALGAASKLNWSVLQEAALATCAFPLAFRARPLSRPAATAGWRVVAIPPAVTGGPADIVQLVPEWTNLLAGEPNPVVSTFSNVDGGTFSNEPLDLVRTALSGLDARNDRRPEYVDRATVLVDPFSDPETLSRPDANRLSKMVGPIIMSLVYNARFKPQDIALAYAEKYFSRYLIAPVGPGPNGERTVGARALATGAIGGFGGFVDKAFLDYDFRLGRLNAAKFLREHLAIPDSAGNKLFKNWTAAQKQEHGVTVNGVFYLPVVPLMRRLRDNPPTLAGWPKLAALPQVLPAAIEARLQSVYDIVKSQVTPDSWWKRMLMNTYLWIGWRLYLRGAARDAATEAIRKALEKHGLL